MAVVLITGRLRLAAELRQLLESRGDTLIELPTTERVGRADVPEVHDALVALASGGFDWLVLTSKFAARVLRGHEISEATHIAVVGPSTAQAVERELNRDVDCMPQSAYSAAALAEALLAQIGDVRPQRMLLAQSARAHSTLAQHLRDAGVDVTVAPIYDIVDVPIPDDVLDAAGAADVVVATSGSALESLFRQLAVHNGSQALAHCQLVALGNQTAEAAAALGLTVAAIARATTPGEVFAAIERVWLA